MMMNILGNIPEESVNVIIISITAAVLGLAVLGYMIWNIACIRASNESIEASNDAIRESNYAIKDKLNQIAESLAKIAESLAKKEKQKQEQASATVTETSNETKLSDDEMRLIQERKKKNEERIANAFSREEEKK